MTDTLIEEYESHFNALLAQPVYHLEQSQKELLLLPLLNLLDRYHRQQCPAYKNIVDLQDGPSEKMEALPYLAVRLFKQLALSSIREESVFRILQSSGTTSQIRSQVILDSATSARQSKVLVKILQETIGRARLPMLIIDSPGVLKDKANFNARAAGIQGIAFFGRDHTYALDENMNIDWPNVEAFCQKYQGQPILIFGFTFMVWQYFIEALLNDNKAIELEQAILLHSGGWKNLESKKVDNEEFKRVIEELTGLRKVFNFYGMAEQVGSVFVECEAGHLHAPLFSDVIVRDPFNLEALEVGKEGILQVLSVLPTSYPGHSILTEDLGKLAGVDNCSCGRKGKYFSISGRLPKTEIRGCSDTHKVESS